MKNMRIELPSGAYFETYIMDSQIYFKEYRKRPAIIIAPGGAYAVHATRESEPIALQFMQMGYQTFVLKYSVGSDRENPDRGLLKNAKYPKQVVEMLETLHIIKQNAEQWNIDKNQIYLMGFSAGGHVCVSCGVRWNDKTIIDQLSFIPKGEELKASGIVVGYPFLTPNSEEFSSKHNIEGVKKTQEILDYVLYQTDTPSKEQIRNVDLLNYVSEKSVPLFIWHSIDDPVVDSRNSTRFVSKLLEFNIPVEYHLFGHGEHGKALSNQLTCMDDSDIDRHLNKWIKMSDYWMKRIGG